MVWSGMIIKVGEHLQLMLEGLECTLHSVLLHKALQLSLAGLNVSLRAGCLLLDSVVVAC